VSSDPRRARPAARAVLGGTFDRFHVGHEALLDAAFRAGRSVAVGVTTARFLHEHPKPLGTRIQSYRTRAGAVQRYLASTFPRRRWVVVPLDDAFGRSTAAEVGALVVSQETAAGGRAVNVRRRQLGRPPIRIVVVPTVLAEDLGPVSSRRIRAGTIDRWGRRRAPIRIGVSAGNPRMAKAVREGLTRTFRPVRVAITPIGQGVAARRAGDADRLAATVAVGRDLGVGVVEPRPGRWTIAVRSGEGGPGARLARGAGETGLVRALPRLLGRRGAKPT
jgi:cytidyltransferase-like protein